MAGPSWASEWPKLQQALAESDHAGGKAHLALCWKPNDLRVLHPDGLFISGVVWSN